MEKGTQNKEHSWNYVEEEERTNRESRQIEAQRRAPYTERSALPSIPPPTAHSYEGRAHDLYTAVLGRFEFTPTR